MNTLDPMEAARREFCDANGLPYVQPDTAAENIEHPATVGDFIRIPAWSVEGMVIDTRRAVQGTDHAIEVLIERRPDDPRPRWYHLEPHQYEWIGA